MKFRIFEEKYGQYPFINTKTLKFEKEKSSYVSRLLSEWKKKEWIIQLKKGIYIINKKNHRQKLDTYFLANNLYTPSYISLESALSFYNIIPEAVFTITSVSTKKTQKIKNKIGTFSYNHLKTSLFFGFKTLELEGQNVFLATAEKALLDFVYLHHAEAKNAQNFCENYRLQNLDTLKKNILNKYLRKIRKKRLEKIIKNILQFSEKTRSELKKI